jgi:hypothetical protein
MHKKTIVLALGLATLAAGLAACEQGYGPTYSRSARYGDNATAATAASNNGSSSTSVEAQRQKIYNQYK